MLEFKYANNVPEEDLDYLLELKIKRIKRIFIMNMKNNKYRNDMLELVGLDDLPPEANF